jgi:broad specificity phosphatase PhoE
MEGRPDGARANALLARRHLVVRCLYITHPEVEIDPAVPAPQWGLSAKGKARAEAFAARQLLPKGVRIISSTERKALETAAIIAAATGSSIESDASFGENDRSATGFLPAAQFEAHVERLFAFPDQSVAGWETAAAAQTRIVAAVETGLATQDPALPLLFVGHGCVGTLLKCHLGGRAIARSEDQRVVGDPGGGNVFGFNNAGPIVMDWVPLERFGKALAF